MPQSVSGIRPWRWAAALAFVGFRDDPNPPGSRRAEGVVSDSWCDRGRRCVGQTSGPGHTHHFDAHVAWLATQTSKTAITELMRIAWRTVGAIITRVWDDTEQLYDPFADLRRIGIDEISYKRGHKYLGSCCRP